MTKKTRFNNNKNKNNNNNVNNTRNYYDTLNDISDKKDYVKMKSTKLSDSNKINSTKSSNNDSTKSSNCNSDSAKSSNYNIDSTNYNIDSAKSSNCSIDSTKTPNYSINSSKNDVDLVSNIIETNTIINDTIDESWQSVKKKKLYKKSIIDSNDIDTKMNIIDNTSLDIDDDGSEYKLEDKWDVWVHLSESSNWSQDSYIKIFTITTIKSFWEFFGNIDKLDIIKYQFFIMRNNSAPTWEHESNRNGGICSLRIIKDRCIEIIEQLSILILNECLSKMPQDINGISFGVRREWGLIKIWNGTRSNDISTQIPGYLMRKYNMTPKYTENRPEY